MTPYIKTNILLHVFELSVCLACVWECCYTKNVFEGKTSYMLPAFCYHHKEIAILSKGHLGFIV